MTELETAPTLTNITEESLVSSVLALFPQCREVFQREGGLRTSDGLLGPDEPVAWFAHRRGIPLDQLLDELNAAAHLGTASTLETEGMSCRCQSRAAEIFLRYGFTISGEFPVPVVNAQEFEMTPAPQDEWAQLIWDALAQCHDPRYPEHSIVDLGYIDGVRCDPRNSAAEVRLVLSTTDPTVTKCIVDQAREKVSGVRSVQDVHVIVDSSRPLRLERIKPVVRQRLGLDW